MAKHSVSAMWSFGFLPVLQAPNSNALSPQEIFMFRKNMVDSSSPFPNECCHSVKVSPAASVKLAPSKVRVVVVETTLCFHRALPTNVQRQFQK